MLTRRPPSVDSGLDGQFLNRVWEEKTRYFERNTHRYFTMLKPILNVCGVTYGGKYGADRPNLACFLDLVQWPTDPLWSKLPRKWRYPQKVCKRSGGVPSL